MDPQASEQSYFELTQNAVSHSDQLTDDVVVDYDKLGGVVGIEFLSAAAAAERDKYLALASCGLKAKLVVPTPASAIRAA